MMRSWPKVSVCMISYNQENYIEKALESVLMQEYDGEIEIVLFDDASTDDTQNMIEDFISKHSEVDWLYIPRQTNVGIAHNFAEALKAGSGKYVAILEGDDYWTDPNKLSTQVRLMEADASLVATYTLCNELNESNGVSNTYGEHRPDLVDLTYLLENGWFIRTPTLTFRASGLNHFPEWFYTSYSTDYILHLLLAENGRIAKLSKVTATYRKHDQGVSVVDSKKQMKRYEIKMRLLDTIDEYFDHQYTRMIETQKSVIYSKMAILALRERHYSFSILRMLSLSRGLDLIKQILTKIFKRAIA